MARTDALMRYIRIMQKLKKRPVNYDQLSDYLQLESQISGYNLDVSKRTIQRDINDIRAIFKVDIQFDWSREAYYIASDDQPEVTERIIESFDTFNALNISERLSEYIHFEKRTPPGTENLYQLLQAIRKKVRIRFAYYSYDEEEQTQREVELYGLKEFRNRWYVLARDTADGPVKSFALDRLTELEVTKKGFHFPSGFDVNEHYKYCFGITGPDDEDPQEIVLSFTPFQGNYIKSLPLHETQEIVADNDCELLVRLKLCITHEFVMELLSYGSNLKVVAPASLAGRMKEHFKNALAVYR